MPVQPWNQAPVWRATVVGTNAGVSLDKAVPTDPNERQYLCAIQASGDAACLVTVTSPIGVTNIWRKRFTAAWTMSENFDPPLAGAVGQGIRVTISASTSNCEVNMQGYSSTT